MKEEVSFSLILHRFFFSHFLSFHYRPPLCITNILFISITASILLLFLITVKFSFLRSNHLGDARNRGNPQRYKWEIPYFPSRQSQRCVLRVRYNTTTDDYHPWETDSRSNGKQNSPIQNNPKVPTGLGHSPLRLAINTAQTGRVFQDRSHVFVLAPRPPSISPRGRVVNLNVRGKRCNIVQVRCL